MSATPESIHASSDLAFSTRNHTVLDFGQRLLGPYLVDFCHWLRSLDWADANNVAYFFVSRDGYLPQLVFNTLFPEDMARSHFVLASRLSAQLAQITDISTAETWLGTSSRSTRAALSTLHAKFQNPKGAGGNLLSARDLMELARHHRDSYSRYLETVAADRYPVVVDVGYGGSSQACFSQLLQREVGGAYFVTHKSATITEATSGPCHAFDEALLQPSSRKGIVNGNRYFFETVLSKPIGSFACFDQAGNPAFNGKYDDERSLQILGDIKKGVLRFAATATAQNRTKEASSETRAAFGDYLRRPSPASAAAFQGLVFDDQLKGFACEYIIAPPQGRNESFGLWPEGQKASDEVQSGASTLQAPGPWFLYEQKLFKAGLSVANYARYATNRKLFLKNNGGLVKSYLISSRNLLYKFLENEQF
jgi:hypothetical protein